MKSADEYAIRMLKIPSLTLMENAGKRIIRILENEIPNVAQKSIFIFCGKGNNGGDGFVCARLLSEKNISVAVVLMDFPKNYSRDALQNYQRLSERVKKISFRSPFKIKEQYDVILDAMFGTSFRGKLTGKYFSAAQWINKQKKSLIAAVDIPSGLNGENGTVENIAVKANFTITLSNPKIGFYCARAKEFTGKIITAEIGIPQTAIVKNFSSVYEVERNDIDLPHRPINSHKHSVGKIFILAGSKGMTGAALLCSQSAIRSGAGAVILGIPDSQFSIVAKRTLEVMPFGLDSTKEGSIAFSALNEIGKKISWCDILLIGPGLSQNTETQELLRKIILTSPKPIVIDADGLNALTGKLEILGKRKSKQIILTPHLGEFSRLIGIPSDAIEKNKIQIGKEFSKKCNLTLVLKGAPTFTFTKNGKVFINSTGNPGMSTAGSGDVLSGIIASLLAQGNSTERAAINGVYIHGAAGDVCAEKFGVYGMIAGDLIEKIPNVMKELSSQ